MQQCLGASAAQLIAEYSSALLLPQNNHPAGNLLRAKQLQRQTTPLTAQATSTLLENAAAPVAAQNLSCTVLSGALKPSQVPCGTATTGPARRPKPSCRNCCTAAARKHSSCCVWGSQMAPKLSSCFKSEFELQSGLSGEVLLVVELCPHRCQLAEAVDEVYFVFCACKQNNKQNNDKNINGEGLEGSLKSRNNIADHMHRSSNFRTASSRIQATRAVRTEHTSRKHKDKPYSPVRVSVERLRS